MLVLAVNVLLLVKLPATFTVPDPASSVPPEVLIVRLFNVAVPAPKLSVPDPTLVKSCPPLIPPPRVIRPEGVPMLQALAIVKAPL